MRWTANVLITNLIIDSNSQFQKYFHTFPHSRAQERAFGPDNRAIDSMRSGEAKYLPPEKPSGGVKRSRSVGSLVDALSTTKDLEEERNTQLRTIEVHL